MNNKGWARSFISLVGKKLLSVQPHSEHSFIKKSECLFFSVFTSGCWNFSRSHVRFFFFYFLTLNIFFSLSFFISQYFLYFFYSCFWIFHKINFFFLSPKIIHSFPLFDAQHSANLSQLKKISLFVHDENKQCFFVLSAFALSLSLRNDLNYNNTIRRVST
jgi:hypothetical protein